MADNRPIPLDGSPGEPKKRFDDTFSGELALLRMMAESCPMRSVVVSDETESREAIAAMEGEGFRLSCVSNTGLTVPMRRLTFLPAEAFTDKRTGDVVGEDVP